MLTEAGSILVKTLFGVLVSRRKFGIQFPGSIKSERISTTEIFFHKVVVQSTSNDVHSKWVSHTRYTLWHNTATSIAIKCLYIAFFTFSTIQKKRADKFLA